LTLQNGFNHVYKDAQKQDTCWSATNFLSNKTVTSHVENAMRNITGNVASTKSQI
jgi:hypothetical protein